MRHLERTRPRRAADRARRRRRAAAGHLPRHAAAVRVLDRARGRARPRASCPGDGHAAGDAAAPAHRLEPRDASRGESALTDGLGDAAAFYHVHSFACRPSDPRRRRRDERVRRALRVRRRARQRHGRAVPPREVLDGRPAHAAQLRGRWRRSRSHDPLPGDRHHGRPGRAARRGQVRGLDHLPRRSAGGRPLAGSRPARASCTSSTSTAPAPARRSRWSTCAGSSTRPASRSSTAAACGPSTPSATPCAPAPSEPSSAPPPSATSTSSTTSSPSSAPRIVVAVDVKDGMIATEGWTQTTSLPAVDAIKRLTGRGVRSFVYTDVSRDGKLTGVDLEAVCRVAEAVRGRFLYSGGIGTLDDLRALAQAPPGQPRRRDRGQVALREEVHHRRGPGRPRRRLGSCALPLVPYGPGAPRGRRGGCAARARPSAWTSSSVAMKRWAIAPVRTAAKPMPTSITVTAMIRRIVL